MAVDWTDLMFAVAAFEADPTEENLIRLNEAREAVRLNAIDSGQLPPVKH